MSSSSPSASPERTATIVTETTILPEHTDDFAAWQLRANEVVAAFPGFLDREVIPPNPPVQMDWVIIQRFASMDAARAWLASIQRTELLRQIQPWLAGNDDVHIFESQNEPLGQRPVSAVISTRVKPGKEDAFKEWERRIAIAQAKFQGYQGSKTEPPIPGVQDDWVSILQFDTAEHLKAWMDSSERQALLAESASFVDTAHIRTVVTGFDSWFRMDDANGPPAAWKQNMLVLLALYPVVFLFGRWIQNPIFGDRFGWPFWFTLFLSNAAGVLILSLVVPRLSHVFAWWLNPTSAASEDANRIRLTGIVLIVLGYGIFLAIFSQLA